MAEKGKFDQVTALAAEVGTEKYHRFKAGIRRFGRLIYGIVVVVFLATAVWVHASDLVGSGANASVASGPLVIPAINNVGVYEGKLGTDFMPRFCPPKGSKYTAFSLEGGVLVHKLTLKAGGEREFYYPPRTAADDAKEGIVVECMSYRMRDKPALVHIEISPP